MTVPPPAAEDISKQTHVNVLRTIQLCTPHQRLQSLRSLTSQASLGAQTNRLISGNGDDVFCLPDLLMILRCLSADPHHIVKEVESIYENILKWGHVFCLCPGCCSESTSTVVFCLLSRETLLGVVVWFGKGGGRPPRPPAAPVGGSRVSQGSFSPVPLLRILM